ncbi:MAG: lipase family protein [Ilumatobacteraceae bacterium]
MRTSSLLTSLVLTSALLVGCTDDGTTSTTAPAPAPSATEAVPSTGAPTTTKPADRTPESTEPAPAPVDGALLGQEPIAAPTGVAATASRLTYRIEGATGDAVEATATLLTPASDAPADGWPLIVWAPGGSGLADACATGASPDLLGQASFLAPALAAGVAVVVPDYEGVGTTAAATFRDSLSLAHATLGAARAARATGSVAQQYAIAGYSVGGQAAIAAAEHAVEWAPDLTLVQVLSIAPAPSSGEALTAHYDEQISAAVAVGDTGTATTLLATKTALLSFLIQGLSVRHPEVQLADFLGANARALAGSVTERCVIDLIVGFYGDISGFVTGGGSLADYPGVLPGWFDQPDMAAALADNAYGTTAIDASVVVVHGPGDQIVPNEATLATVESLGAAGTDVAYIETTATDHRAQLTAPETAAARDQLVQALMGAA